MMRPGDHLRLARLAVAALAGLGALALPAQVVPVTPPQQAPGQVPPKRPPPRTAEDSAQARRDSLKALPLVHWALVDSVGLELLQRKGYQLVRYQAEGVRFGANERTIVLTGVKGERAAVQREPTVLVSDTIVYSDTSSLVAAAGESIFRDPTRGGGDLTSSGKMRYSLNTKVGVATRVNAEDKAAGQDWFISAQRAGFGMIGLSVMMGLPFARG